MAVELKFCGLTRAADAQEGVRLGARYLGVIFAGGPRLVSPERAAAVLAAMPSDVRKVGVFADVDPATVRGAASTAGLHVAQLHGGADAPALDRLRRLFDGELWAVVRVAGSLPAHAASLFQAADAVLLDAGVAGRLGGTGVALDWAALAGPVARARAAGSARLVLAGGLTPENVAAAIAHLSPDIVDVSSGVETAPGIKDPVRMRAFAVAAGVTPSER